MADIHRTASPQLTLFVSDYQRLSLERYERADSQLQQLKKGDSPCRSH